MSLTLNEVISSLSSIATNHRQINHFFYGNPWDFATSGTVDCPAVIVDQKPFELNGSTLTRIFTVYVGDIIHKDKSNRKDVFSDTEQIALDIIYQLQDSTIYSWVVDQSITLEQFEDELDIELSGFSFTLKLKISSPFDRCAIPSITTATGTPGCAPVTIYNSLGVVIATVSSGGTYTTPSTSVTVQNSDASYSTTTSTNLTLADNTYIINVDGVLQQTVTGPSLKNQVINIIE